MDPAYAKKHLKKLPGTCQWCSYPMAPNIHKNCIQRPHWHNAKEYWMWMCHPERPSRDGYRSRRVFTPAERKKVSEWQVSCMGRNGELPGLPWWDEWENEKRQDITNDLINN